jgi:hypothetical protein
MLHVRLTVRATSVLSVPRLLERPEAAWSHISHTGGKRPMSWSSQSVGFGLVKRTLDDPRHPGTPRLFFQKHVKPVGACTGDHRARLFFPGHFIPAPLFNEGTALVGN